MQVPYADSHDSSTHQSHYLVTLRLWGIVVSLLSLSLFSLSFFGSLFAILWLFYIEKMTHTYVDMERILYSLVAGMTVDVLLFRRRAILKP